MDVVLVGLPGSGKSAVGRRLARRHEADYVDLDETIETTAGARIPEIFAEEGEAGFRARERAAVADLGAPDPDTRVRRVVSTGGGAIIDPRNRWRLYHGRLPVWLDVRPEVLAQRLRRSPNVRPLVAGRNDPVATIRELAAARDRFYRAAVRVSGTAEPTSVLAAVEAAVEAAAEADPATRPTRVLDAATPIGRLAIGERIAAAATAEALDRLGARRAIVISEPNAAAALADAVAAALEAGGRSVERLDLPTGESAKGLAVVETAARELARRRVERGDPIVAVGGGALGDAAGFIAAIWLRGVALVQVPTTLVAQIDSAIGGKTAVDLPEGKNLVGAFHQPASIVVDVGALRSLPTRHRRAALAEAVKMAVLGDERLFELLETRGEAIAAGEAVAFEEGWIAELVERCAWAKVEVVVADERETGADGGRIALNLGHTIGHGLEAADGYASLLHGEAVAAGLRGAIRIGLATGLTPPDRAVRIELLLDRLGLATGPLDLAAADVLAAMSRDKKHAAGRLRWVIPTAEAVVVRTDIPDALVAAVVAEVLAGAPARVSADA